MELTKTINKLKWKLEFSKYKYWWHFFVGVNEKTGEKKPFFIQYYAVNPQESSLNPQFTEPSYAMVRVGTWGKDKTQVSNFYGGNYFNILDYGKEEIAIGHCIVCENYLKGDVYLGKISSELHREFMCCSGSFAWELKKESKSPYYLQNSMLNITCKTNEFNTLYSGYIKYNGEEYKVTPEECCGHEAKVYVNAGLSYWCKLMCSNLVEENENNTENNISILSFSPIVFGKKLGKDIAICLNVKDKMYKYSNSILSGNSIKKFECVEEDSNVKLYLEAENEDSKIKVNFVDAKDNMMRLCYKQIENLDITSGFWSSGNAEGYVKVYEKENEEFILKHNLKGKMGNLEYYKKTL